MDKRGKGLLLFFRLTTAHFIFICVYHTAMQVYSETYRMARDGYNND
ncbi:hypothetical protein ABVL1U2_580007 [Acinetobacter baumannii]|nr:hypothetical protein ABVL1U2_580007 [Acinetobacter baumannii]